MNQPSDRVRVGYGGTQTTHNVESTIRTHGWDPALGRNTLLQS